MWSDSPTQCAMLTAIEWVEKYFQKKKSKIFKYLTAGVCYTAAECRDMHGSAEGSCAQGFGTCCVFIYNGVDKNKKEVLGRRISYIENPSTSMRTKTLEIKANNKGRIKRKLSPGLSCLTILPEMVLDSSLPL